MEMYIVQSYLNLKYEVENHSDMHPHFECVDCGKIDCLTLEVQIPTIPNREVRSSQILFRGICEACFSLN